MDRKLVLLRHAKSAWVDTELDDFARPLAPRGHRAAPLIARHLLAHGGAPDLVLCSPAQRALETWFHLAPQCPKARVDMVRALYLAAPPTLLQVLGAQPDDCRTVLIIGHNPGLQALAVSLCGTGRERDLRRMRAKFPTAAYADIDLPAATWSSVALGSGHLQRFVRPKDIEQGRKRPGSDPGV